MRRVPRRGRRRRMAAYAGRRPWCRSAARREGDGRGQFYLGFWPQLASFVDQPLPLCAQDARSLPIERQRSREIPATRSAEEAGNVPGLAIGEVRGGDSCAQSKWIFCLTIYQGSFLSRKTSTDYVAYGPARKKTPPELTDVGRSVQGRCMKGETRSRTSSENNPT